MFVRPVIVITALAILLPNLARAEPISDQKQYAMVLTASEILEQAQCGAQEKPITFSRLLANGIDVKGRDNAQFIVTMNAVAKIYLTDPAAFCRRAGR
jgi:hypothetical protein